MLDTRSDALLSSTPQIGFQCFPCMQAVVVPSLEETPEQGAEEAIVEHKVNYDYLLSMPISSLTLEKVGTAGVPWGMLTLQDLDPH